MNNYLRVHVSDDGDYLELLKTLNNNLIDKLTETNSLLQNILDKIGPDTNSEQIIGVGELRTPSVYITGTATLYDNHSGSSFSVDFDNDKWEYTVYGDETEVAGNAGFTSNTLYFASRGYTIAASQPQYVDKYMIVTETVVKTEGVRTPARMSLPLTSGNHVVHLIYDDGKTFDTGGFINITNISINPDTP